jgi:hypothetical protein
MLHASVFGRKIVQFRNAYIRALPPVPAKHVHVCSRHICNVKYAQGYSILDYHASKIETLGVKAEVLKKP